ncbi:MAG TPA: L,D-transpeptidase, partial [Ignavibacteria bacterium]|nr:L,D-transpeptidase [Ignavibacteria bacterium]
HGCIRMSHKHAEQMFNDAEMGTLVLVHYSGKHARTVGFAPKGYKGKEYTETEQKRMLADNLLNVLNGNYFTAEREFFVVDPKIIPMSGIYVGYDKKLPKIQKMPTASYYFKMNPDVLKMRHNYETYWEEKDAEGDFQLTAAGTVNEEAKQLSVSSDEELIKKYFHNPIGILPYYPPSKPRTSTNYVSTSNDSGDDGSSNSGSDEGSE